MKNCTWLLAVSMLAVSHWVSAATITVVSGSGQVARSGAYFPDPIVAVVRDDAGHPVPDVGVWVVPRSGAETLVSSDYDQLPIAHRTNAQGEFRMGGLYANGGPGTDVVSVRTSVASGSADFHFEIQGGRPRSVRILSGAGQVTAPGTPFPAPLTAQVVDEHGEVIPFAAVKFLAAWSGFDGAGAYIGYPNGWHDAWAKADAAGVAVSPTLFANQIAGSWTAWAWPGGHLEISTTAEMINGKFVVPDASLLPLTGSIDHRGADPVEIGVRLLDAFGVPLAGETIKFTIESGLAVGSLSPAQVKTDARGFAHTKAYSNGVAGTYTVIARWFQHAASISVRKAASATVRFQDMWWAGPGENGWGLSITQNGEALFPVIYGYGSDGSPNWYVMPAGTWNSSRTVFSGLLYSPHGSPFFSYDPSRFQAGAPVGVATMTFDGADRADLEFTIDGVVGRKKISRQAFGAGGAGSLSVGGMWWGGAAQNGWGVSIMQQGSALFIVWFTYDEAGRVVWYVLPGGEWTSAATYEGRAYKTAGSPLASYEPARFRITDVGSFRLRFEGDAATLEYGIEGRSGTLALTRQPF